MELWCFLQAFQKSKWKYLYFSQITEVLLHLRDVDFNFKAFQVAFFERNPELIKLPFWNEVLANSQKLMDVEQSLRAKISCEFIFLGESRYPKNLERISDPPLALSVEGDIQILDEKLTIGVVGSREPHDFTTRWLKEDFYQALKERPVCTVSGGARGVDQIVHQISLFLGQKTCVVLPSGLMEKYPALWRDSKKWIAEGAIFISEMPLGTRISKHHFVSRNRIIAALSSRLIIAEAKQNSGTLMTAHHALIENRPVFVVPGHPLMREFSGSLGLLEKGAGIMRNALDVAEVLSQEFY